MRRFLKILGGLFVALVVLVAALSVLGGRGESETVASRCETVADAIVTGITNGLTIDGGGSLRGAQAVRSTDYEDIWFVAVDLEGPGLDGTTQIAVWALTDITTPKALPAPANAIAAEFSRYGDGTVTYAPDADGLAEARQCVRDVL